MDPLDECRGFRKRHRAVPHWEATWKWQGATNYPITVRLCARCIDELENWLFHSQFLPPGSIIDYRAHFTGRLALPR